MSTYIYISSISPRKLMMDENIESFDECGRQKEDVECLRVSSEKGEEEILIDIEHFLKLDLSLFPVLRD